MHENTEKKHTLEMNQPFVELQKPLLRPSECHCENNGVQLFLPGRKNGLLRSVVDSRGTRMRTTLTLMVPMSPISSALQQVPG